MVSRKVFWIVNPASGRGAGKNTESHLAACLGSDYVAGATIAYTACFGEARSLASQAAEDGFEVVAACGGDGTLMECAEALLGSETVLAPIPLGTGNDFMRTFQGKLSLKKAIQGACYGTYRTVDLMSWQGSEKSGVSINACGVGFDAAVAIRTNLGFRFAKGTFAYILAVLKTLSSYRATSMRIEVDGEVLETEAMLCCIANSRSYGGGMMIAPNAKLDDGKLELVLIEKTSVLEFLLAFPKVFYGSHLSHPKVRHRTGVQVRVSSESPVHVLCDGEIVCSTPVSIEVRPKTLRVATLP